MKKITCFVITFIFIFSIFGCSCKKEEVNSGSIVVPMTMAYYTKNIEGKYTIVYPFNTSISLLYFYESEANLAKDYFKNEYLKMHELFDRHYYYFKEDGSLINNLRIINESNGESIIVDEDLITIFKEGIKFTKLSKGKFNIAVGNLADLWDGFIKIGNYKEYVDLSKMKTYSYFNGIYSEDINGNYIDFYGIYVDISNMNKYSLSEDKTYIENNNGDYVYVENIAPSEEQINQALLCTPSYEEIDNIILIDEENNTITINEMTGCNGSVSVTLGALAKSYAAEKIGNDEKIKNGNFLINAGQSTIKIIGDNLSRDSGDWNIGITDSYLVYSKETKYASYLMNLKDSLSVSTSSGDENHYYSNNHYYHHIIDPLSGYPNENRFAVTAVTENAMYADIITTAMMSMNIEETKKFLTILKDNDINSEIFIQEKENDTNKIYATNSMKKWVSIRNVDNLNEYLNSIIIEEFVYDFKEE